MCLNTYFEPPFYVFKHITNFRYSTFRLFYLSNPRKFFNNKKTGYFSVPVLLFVCLIQIYLDD